MWWWIAILGGGGIIAWQLIMRNVAPAVLPDNYKLFWGPINAASAKYGVPIPVLYGILQQESNGQLIEAGPDGHDRGPWQINDIAHADWIATHDPLDPVASTDYAASILAAGVQHFQDLRAGIASYNAGIGNVTVANPDVHTTGGDYSASVLAKADTFANLLGIDFTA